LLNYQNNTEAYQQNKPIQLSHRNHPLAITIGVLGAGNYATATFLPALRSTKPFCLLSIASGSGSAHGMPPTNSVLKKWIPP
jgi:hypothetical protein